MSRACRLLGLCALWLSLSTGAQAACTVASTGVSFGAYQPLTFAGKFNSATANSTGTITVSCSTLLAGVCVSLVSYSLELSAGSSGTVAARAMPGPGGSRMNYNLYTDAARTQVWGTAGGSIISATVAGCGAASHTVYGRIPSGQATLKPGAYTEPLTITVSYSP